MSSRNDQVEAALAANSTAPNYWDPTESDYHEDEAKEGIPFIVIAILTLIAFLIFFIIRIVLCTCCGKGCCARNKKPVTTKVVLLNVALCAIPIVINFIGGAMLMASARPVNRSLNSFFDTTLEQLDLVRAEVANISTTAEDAVAQLPDDVEIDLSQITDAEQQLNDAREDIADSEDDARRYMNIIENVIWAVGAASFALGLWGFVTLLGRRSPFMTVFLLAAAIFGPVCWLLGGAGFATKDIIDDACSMMQRHVDGELNPWVLREARCGELLEASEAIGPLMMTANALVREGNEGLAQAKAVTQVVQPDQEPVKTLCIPFSNSTGSWQENQDVEPGCFRLTDGRQAAEAEYGDNVCQEDLPPDDTQSPAFLQCVVAGRPIKQQEYQLILNASDVIQSVSGALPVISRLVQCEFIDRAFREVITEECPDIEHDFNRMTAAAVLSAIGITFASLYFCVCFRNLRHRRYKPGTEDDPDYYPKKDVDSPNAVDGYNDSAHH